jgi:hypothetical protein
VHAYCWGERKRGGATESCSLCFSGLTRSLPFGFLTRAAEENEHGQWQHRVHQARRKKTNMANGNIVFTKLGGRRRTRPSATSCSPSSAKEDEHGHWQHRVHQARRKKTNTAIGNIMFTLFSRRYAHRKIRVLPGNGHASLLMLAGITHQLTFPVVTCHVMRSALTDCDNADR